MHIFSSSAPHGLVLVAPGGGQDHTSTGVVPRGYSVFVTARSRQHPGSPPRLPTPVLFRIQARSDPR